MMMMMMMHIANILTIKLIDFWNNFDSITKNTWKISGYTVPIHRHHHHHHYYYYYYYYYIFVE